MRLRSLPLMLAVCLVGLVLASSTRAADDLRVGSVRVNRILYLGNSITRHGPKADIDWHDDWGMAASSREKDYVHVLTARIAKAAGGEPAIRVRNIADFERGYQNFDVAGQFKDELAFKPDLVIVAVGENVPALTTDEQRAAYQRAFAGLLAELKRHGDPTIIVRSSFYADAAKDEAMRAAAEKAGVPFADIRALGSDPKNYGRAERSFKHDGVANHPGDRGMQAIADAIWAVLEKHAQK